MKLTYNISIKAGVMTIHNRSKMLTDVSKVKDMKGLITIEKKKSKRSTYQNSYYWAGVLQCAKQGFFDAGHSLTKDEIHEEFKRRFLEGKEIINKDTGERIIIPGTTTNLTKSDFSDYISEIKGFCIEWLNCSIPDPDEQLTIN